MLTFAPGERGPGQLQGTRLLFHGSKELSHGFPHLGGHCKLCPCSALSEMPRGSPEVSRVKEKKEGSQGWGDLEPGNDVTQMFPREVSNPKRAGVV